MMKTRFAAIDGLRGLAALYVVIFHLFHTLPVLPWYLAPFRYGHFAVSLFIVLSGFCLVYPLLKNNAATFNVFTFIKRRTIRLIPALWVATALAFAVQIIYWHRPVTLNNVLVHVLMLHDLFSYESLTYPYWSLAIEWRIYFVFAALVFLWRRTNFFTMTVVGICLGVFLSVALRDTRWFVMMWQYLALFFFGAAVASIHYHGKYQISLYGFVSFLALALFACNVTVLGPLSAKVMPHLLVNDMLIGIGFSALLVVILHFATLSRILSIKPVAFLGTISYSLYLMHAVFIVLISHLLIRPSPTTCLIYLAIALPIILLLSYLFYLAFERPFVRINRASE